MIEHIRDGAVFLLGAFLILSAWTAGSLLWAAFRRWNERR